MGWTETNFTITDAQSGVEHAVSVSLPFRYSELDRAPVIFCLDGGWTSGTVRDATRQMSMGGSAPEAVVVGVSFTDDTMRTYLRSRARWYTPTAWVPPTETGVKDVVADDCGHAAAFLNLLRDQIIPRIESEFDVGERWLVGHSFSALFGLHTLFAEPELFAKYLLMSPSIWWDDRAMLETERAYAAEHADLAASVFLSAGEAEDMVFMTGEYRMRANVEAIAQSLKNRSYPNLEISYSVMPGETHSSTVGAAVSRGLRTLTAGPDAL